MGDLGLLATRPVFADFLLWLANIASGCYVNGNIRDFMCFKQSEAISTLSGKNLKSVTSSLNSTAMNNLTESNANIFMEKRWKPDLW